MKGPPVCAFSLISAEGTAHALMSSHETRMMVTSSGDLYQPTNARHWLHAAPFAYNAFESSAFMIVAPDGEHMLKAIDRK